MDTCPRGVGLSDAHAVFVGNCLPTPWRSSVLEGLPVILLPPFWRSALRWAAERVAEWNAQQAEQRKRKAH